ncbi:hypothetical protein [Kitasatospora sp. NPDC057223]
MIITTTTASAVFTTAATATHWKATNLGLTTHVNHGGARVQA